MAAAEARAVWQRTANRFFVQEDAKRAPKLACCQSSSSTKQVDAGPTGTEDAVDHPVAGFMPFGRNPSFCNMPSEAKWWLQLQPGYGYQRSLDIELEIMKANGGNFSSKSGESPSCEESNCDGQKCVDELQEATTVDSDCIKKTDNMSIMGSYEFVELNHFGSSLSKQTSDLAFDSDSAWMGNEKTEPWWRITDKDNIASLVAKKSLGHVENCDLPPPQKVHVRENHYSHLGCFDCCKGLESSLDWRTPQQGVVKSTGQALVGCPDLGQSIAMKWAPDEGDQLPYGSEKSSSQNSCSTNEDDSKAVCSSDASKAQLLEALCHSQTRAREAEKAVRRVNAEKEHIIKLFFRQASQLFAYKQWFQLLQLESMYVQVKNSNEPISSTFFPMFCPWTPSKSKKLSKSWQRGKRGRRGQIRVDVTKYAVAIALGLGLVGAGLLLGWTVGWMLPPF